MKPTTIVLNKVNKRVYTFLKRPDFQLEPQAQIILKVIEEAKHLFRYSLLDQLSALVETERTVSQVLSFHQRTLTRCGCIMVEEFDVWEERTKNERTNMEVKIVPNDRGGYGIQIGADEPIGNYSSEQDAQLTLERSCL